MRKYTEKEKCVTIDRTLIFSWRTRINGLREELDQNRKLSHSLHFNLFINIRLQYKYNQQETVQDNDIAFYTILY